MSKIGLGLGIKRTNEKEVIIDGVMKKGVDGKFTYLTGEMYKDFRDSGINMRIVEGEEFIGKPEEGIGQASVQCILTGDVETGVATVQVAGMLENSLLRANYIKEEELDDHFYVRLKIVAKGGSGESFDVSMQNFIPLGDLLKGTNKVNLEQSFKDLDSSGGLAQVMGKVMEQVMVFNQHIDEKLYEEGA